MDKTRTCCTGNHFAISAVQATIYHHNNHVPTNNTRAEILLFDTTTEVDVVTKTVSFVHLCLIFNRISTGSSAA